MIFLVPSNPVHMGIISFVIIVLLFPTLKQLFFFCILFHTVSLSRTSSHLEGNVLPQTGTSVQEEGGALFPLTWTQLWSFSVTDPEGLSK